MVCKNNVSSVNHVGVNEIQSGASFANSLAKAMESKNVAGVIGMATSIIPGVSAVVSFLGFVLSFFGTNESHELAEIKRLLKEVSTRLDSVEIHLQDIQRNIKWTQIKSQFARIEQEINTNFVYLQNIYSHPLSVKNAEKDIFMNVFRTTCWTCSMDLYHGIMGADCALTGDLFQIAMKSFNYDRKRTQHFMIGILQLLIKGVTIELSYMKLKYGDDLYNIHKIDWVNQMANVINRMKTIDQTLQDKYHEQASIDIDKLSAEQHSLSNDKFSTILYDFLRDKYYWRDWLVIVYRPIRGLHNHINHACNGFTKYGVYGRNIVVASVDSSKTHFKDSEANNILAGHPYSYTTYTRRRRSICKRGVFRKCLSVSHHTYNAQQIYDRFPVSARSQCNPYASAGVIDGNADARYIYTSGRFVYKRTPGEKPYYVHLFG